MTPQLLVWWMRKFGELTRPIWWHPDGYAPGYVIPAPLLPGESPHMMALYGDRHVALVPFTALRFPG